ncbi:s-methyl-5-thioribose-1-phosphate isomerase [Arvimicrobium flavum]|uniref:s-methyl-5-thioribose-1-phosphate isomerase n=1 Tax=Arvimicrobium flavum TaxID=3393320 RepID=UPI00237AC81E|nr:s-methyl-5-thioribose-1-phosphate isomerase [Mesorhizobium shangrilense]
MLQRKTTLPTLYVESVLLDSGAVRILDRRVFPFSKEFVVCANHEEVAIAIEQMVTQSNGPFYAAGGGMVLEARAAERERDPVRRLHMMKAAGARLVRTRPTNNNISTAIRSILVFAEEHAAGNGFADAVEKFVLDQWEGRRSQARAVGRHANSLVADGERILTHCWSEGALLETLAAAKDEGKRIELLCTETRPYLQGARLTAHSAAEMGIDTTVIADGMVAHAMASGRVSMLMTAADRVTMSGHVINKVGTLNAAIAARHFKVPYFATVLRPDPKAPTPADVPIEERDGDETLYCLGIRTASPLAKGWYPAFDVTPPELVSGVVTERGIFAAAALPQSFPAQHL